MLTKQNIESEFIERYGLLFNCYIMAFRATKYVIFVRNLYVTYIWISSNIGLGPGPASGHGAGLHEISLVIKYPANLNLSLWILFSESNQYGHCIGFKTSNFNFS